MKTLAMVVLAGTVLGAAILLGAQDRPAEGHGFMGVQLAELDDATAAELDLETAAGVLIVGLLPDYPAEAAGVKRNDVIRKIDGDTIDTRQGLSEKIRQTKPGQLIRLTVMRQKKELEISLTLAARPAATAPARPELPN